MAHIHNSSFLTHEARGASARGIAGIVARLSVFVFLPVFL